MRDDSIILGGIDVDPTGQPVIDQLTEIGEISVTAPSAPSMPEAPREP